MKRAAALVLVLALVAVLALAGCSEDPGDGTADYAAAPACVVPLSCDPAPVYPWAAHPFYGYFTPYASHIRIDVYNGRPAPVYRPYTAPILPGYRAPAPPAPAAQAPKPAAPAAQAPKPAAPAPKPAAPAPRPVTVRSK